MSNGDVSQGRRRFLIGATSVVGGVGVVGAAVPFVASWNPSAKAEATGAPVTVNIDKIEPGQQITVEWRGKPVWIIRRTPEMLDNIEKITPRLKDPESTATSQQPEYISGPTRSLKPEFAVLVGLCTHLGSRLPGCAAGLRFGPADRQFCDSTCRRFAIRSSRSAVRT